MTKSSKLYCIVILVLDNWREWDVGLFADLEEGRKAVVSLLPDTVLNWQKCTNPGETEAYMWLAEPVESLFFDNTLIKRFKVCYIEVGYVNMSPAQFSSSWTTTGVK